MKLEYTYMSDRLQWSERELTTYKCAIYAKHQLNKMRIVILRLKSAHAKYKKRHEVRPSAKTHHCDGCIGVCLCVHIPSVTTVQQAAA